MRLRISANCWVVIEPNNLPFSPTFAGIVNTTFSIADFTLLYQHRWLSNRQSFESGWNAVANRIHIYSTRVYHRLANEFLRRLPRDDEPNSVSTVAAFRSHFPALEGHALDASRDECQPDDLRIFRALAIVGS